MAKPKAADRSSLASRMRAKQQATKRDFDRFMREIAKIRAATDGKS